MTSPIDTLDFSGIMPFSIICQPTIAGSWQRLTEVGTGKQVHPIPKGVSQLAVTWTGKGEVRIFNIPRNGEPGRQIASLANGTDLAPKTAFIEAHSDDGQGTIHASMVSITTQDVSEGGRCAIRVMPTPPAA